MKAYKIETKIDRGFSIYIAENAGSAKTLAVSSMREGWRDATYSWVTSCRRAHEFDYLAPGNDNSCIAWSHEGERWQIDRFPSHWWWGDEPAPNNACTRQVAGCASSEVLSTPAATCG